MGGLAGVIHFRGEAPTREQALRLSQLVALRGPDEEGMFLEGPAALVHRRNAAVPGGRAQPLVGERFVLLLDGRIYDHIDMARQLRPEAGGAALGDAEVLLGAWERWQEKCLEKLDGEYAFAIWDRRELRLHLVRGPMGQRPLFYACQGSRLAFSSLAAGLCCVPWVSKEVEPRNVSEYLTFRYVHAPRTILRDVQCLLPGSVLSFDGSSSSLKRFRLPRFAPPESSSPRDDETLPEIDRLLRRATERRILAGEPAVILLSGGIDSSLIARAASLAGHELSTWHLVLDGSGVSESAYAGRVAALLGAEHHEVHVDAEDFDHAFEYVIQAMGVPPPDPAAVAQYLLLRQLRGAHRVALAGDGGDQVFGGGPIAAAASSLHRTERLELLPFPLDRVVRGVLGRAGFDSLATRPGRFGRDLRVGGTSVFDDDARKRILAEGIDPRPGLKKLILDAFYENLQTDPLNAILGMYQQGWLAEDILPRSDRMGASCGVELRFPLLDLELVQALNLLPGRFKVPYHRLGGVVTKYISRALLEGQIPKSILQRPKMSMPSPLHGWLRSAGSWFMSHRVEGLLENRWNLWRPDPIRAMALAHERGEANHGGALWVLIMLDAWLESIHR